MERNRRTGSPVRPCLKAEIISGEATALSRHPVAALESQSSIMWQPFAGWNRRQVGWAFAVTALLTVGMSVLLSATGRPLRTAATPDGVLDLELAGGQERAQAVLRSWQEDDVATLAGFLIGVDYLYIILYSTCLSLGCVWAVHQLWSPRLATAGTALAWLQWGAGLLDGIENLALLAMLRGNGDVLWPRVARICSLSKFAFIALGALFIATVYACSRLVAAAPARFGRLGRDRG